jgi:hypothetical protein
MTERRREALRTVKHDRVLYDGPQAAYLIDGEPARTWDFRTLSELRRAGLIEPEDVSVVSRVRITEAGASALVGKGQ